MGLVCLALFLNCLPCLHRGGNLPVLLQWEKNCANLRYVAPPQADKQSISQTSKALTKQYYNVLLQSMTFLTYIFKAPTCQLANLNKNKRKTCNNSGIPCAFSLLGFGLQLGLGFRV